MEKNKRFILCILALASCIFFSATAYAAAGRPQKRPYQKKASWMMQKMNLSLEQKEKIRQMRQKNRQVVVDLLKNAREKRQELAQELNKTKLDTQKINSLVSDLKEIQGRLIEEKVNAAIKMKEILTPEQYQIFLEGFRDLRHEKNF